MAIAARKAGVAIVGGDTKVVEHGKADGMYVTTFGIGERRRARDARSRDDPPGRQGTALGTDRRSRHHDSAWRAASSICEADLVSDTRSVWPFVAALLEACAPGLRWMRDPTRGGVATSLNELVREGSGYGIAIFEERVPMHDAVRGACELLGLDPLHIANEGQFLAVVAPEYADAALAAVRGVSGGEGAVYVGEVQSRTKAVRDRRQRLRRNARYRYARR